MADATPAGPGSLLLRWWGPITAAVGLLVGGGAIYTRGQAVADRVWVLEQAKPADVRDRVDRLEALAREQQAILQRVDRRVALMACKLDKAECK